MGYDRSLQQRLDENDSPVLLLTQQYRMHPEIAEFPSTHFYGGRLVQDDNMREWTRQDYHRDRAFKPLLFLDVQGSQSQVSGSTSLRNLSEVEAVVQLVRRLLEKFPRIDWKKRIGVIAPYKQQIYEVRGAIGRLEAEFNRRLGIEVNTVDGFQGREKEIIIYSCVRTSHGGRKKKKRRGDNEDDDVLDAFWADERRMNVAITRAKSSLWIVGNSALLKQSRAWRALIQHTKDHKRYIADSASTLFASSSSKTSGKKERDASKTK
jgi:senataxin